MLQLLNSSSLYLQPKAKALLLAPPDPPTQQPCGVENCDSCDKLGAGFCDVFGW